MYRNQLLAFAPWEVTKLKWGIPTAFAAVANFIVSSKSM